MFTRMLEQNLIGRVRHEVPKRLDEWPIWRTDVLIAGTQQYGRTLAVSDPSGFDAEPSFPNARFAG